MNHQNHHEGSRKMSMRLAGRGALAAVLFLMELPAVVAAAVPPGRLAIREITPRSGGAAPFLSRPVAIVCGEGVVYVLDAADGDIKVFGRDGAYRNTLGRKGQGPGEFRLPNDLDVFEGRLYVADTANRRLQILSADGKPVGGFVVGLAPWRILVLEKDRIVVAGLPSGRARDEKLLSCFREDGRLVWRAIEARRSGDAVHDALKDQVMIRRAAGGGLRVIRAFDDRAVVSLNIDGFRTGAEFVPEDGLPFQKIAVATAGGHQKTLKGLCWTAADDGGRLFLLRPGYAEDGDLGPGSAAAVLGSGLELEALIEFPGPMSRLAVSGRLIYAVDTDCRLRLFEIEERGRGR